MERPDTERCAPPDEALMEQYWEAFRSFERGVRPSYGAHAAGLRAVAEFVLTEASETRGEER